MHQPNQGFHQRLHALSAAQQQAFMAALCERLLPNYALYAQMAESGNPAALRAILDLVWERLSVREARIDFERQAEKLAELEPASVEASATTASVARRAPKLSSTLAGSSSARFSAWRSKSMRASRTLSRSQTRSRMARKAAGLPLSAIWAYNA